MRKISCHLFQTKKNQADITEAFMSTSHYEITIMQIYRKFYKKKKKKKHENFQIKFLIFFIFLLKTKIVGTR